MGGLLPERGDADGAQRAALACAERVVTVLSQRFLAVRIRYLAVFGMCPINCSWRPHGSTHEWRFGRRSTASSYRAVYAPQGRRANRGATSSCCYPAHGGRPSRRTWCLYQPLIGREVEPAFFVTRAAALVAARTSTSEDRQYVLGEALRFRRAQLSRGRGHVGNHQASAKCDRRCCQVSSFHYLRSGIHLRRRQER